MFYKILLLFLKTLESSLARAGTFLGVEREVNRFKIKKERKQIMYISKLVGYISLNKSIHELSNLVILISY